MKHESAEAGGGFSVSSICSTEEPSTITRHPLLILILQTRSSARVITAAITSQVVDDRACRLGGGRRVLLVGRANEPRTDMDRMASCLSLAVRNVFAWENTWKDRFDLPDLTKGFLGAWWVQVAAVQPHTEAAKVQKESSSPTDLRPRVVNWQI